MAMQNAFIRFVHTAIRRDLNDLRVERSLSGRVKLCMYVVVGCSTSTSLGRYVSLCF